MSKVFIQPQPLPIEKAGGGGVKKKQAKPDVKQDFQHVLEKTRQEKKVQFSAHALKRLEERNIKLEQEDVGKLEEAVDRAAAKGSRSSLLVYRDIAFVAGVDNKTIITAMDGDSIKEHVFTNIDSAVFVE